MVVQDGFKCWRFLFCVYLLVICSQSVVFGRIHTLSLKNEERDKFPVSTFGFYSGGFLYVNISVSYKSIHGTHNMLGFTLEKTSSTGVSSYFENNFQGPECVLKRQGKGDVLGSDHAVSVLLMVMDVTNNITSLSFHGGDIKDLKITGTKSGANTKEGAKTTTTMINSTQVTTTETTGMTNTTISTAKLTTPTNPPPGKDSATNQIPLNKTIVNDILYLKSQFKVNVNKPKEEGLYNLYFHNCNNNEKKSIKLNITLEVVEHNPNSYLSAGEIPMPQMYFALCLLFFFTGCFWLYILKTSKDGVYKMHYLMLILVYFKTVSFMFHGINYHFIGVDGKQEEAWAILYYITHLMKGSLLFLTIILIGTGWTFIKHMLTEREKKIFLVVIPLQVLSNVAQIIIDETEEGESRYTVWKTILVLVDLLCCGAILFPVIWSIKHLQEASHTDGKAAINLNKLKLFRQFYILIVCYIYFTRIIVYLVQMAMTYRYSPWLDELFKELSTYVLFVVTGYKFRPASDNPYLQIPVEDNDDIEMDEVITKSGAYDTLTKVNTTVKQRESSHEYD